MATALRLNFGRDVTVLSDDAIPFSVNWLAGGRVAIIDDVVNFGSTLARAAGLVLAAGADEVECFALAGKRLALPPLPTVPLNLISDGVLSDATLADYARRVPAALQKMATPFDLAFPLIECVLALPFRGAADVEAALQDVKEVSAVHNLTTYQGGDSGIRRLTADFSCVKSGNLKARLYFDESTSSCTLVPMAIRPVLSIESEQDALAELVRGQLELMPPVLRELVGFEPEARLCLFMESLRAGEKMLEILSPVLGPSSPVKFDLDRASLLFGPSIIEAPQDAIFWSDTCSDISWKDDYGRSELSPFLMKSNFAERIGEILSDQNLQGKPDDFFAAIFENLATMVGACEPGAYTLRWPYGRKVVDREPYLRLRVGPTFDDLVWLVSKYYSAARSLPALTIRAGVSELLDSLIDQGVVVPTVANYEGAFYRIYRKGESDSRNRTRDVVLKGWELYGHPLSLTRSSKMVAVLSLMGDLNLPIRPFALERGVVGVFDEDEWIHGIEGEATPVVRYFRDTGELVQVD